MSKPEQVDSIAAPDKAKHKVNQHIYQQSFLGASITNFSINLGFNSSASTLNVSLVEDARTTEDGKGFERNPNAVLEGYHPWDTHAFPLGLYKATRVSGTTVGIPCDPNSCKNDVRPWVNCECDELETRRVNDKVPDYLINGDYFFKPEVGAPVYFNYKLRQFHNQHPDFIPAGAADRYDYSDRSVFEFNGLLKSVKRDYSDRGITYSVEVEDPRQILEDTIVLLGEKFIKPISPPDTDFPIEVTGFHDGQGLKGLGGGAGGHGVDRPIPNKRYSTDDYVGYYNILNVYGYYEFAWKRPNVEGTAKLDKDGKESKFSNSIDELQSQNSNVNGRFGNAQYNSSGMVWYDPTRKIEPPFGCSTADADYSAPLGAGRFEEHPLGILPALDFMLMGRDECYKRINEPMGGPLYYAFDDLNTTSGEDPFDKGTAHQGIILGAGSSDDEKKTGYRYKVDLTDLYNLHKTDNKPVKLEKTDAQTGNKVGAGTLGGGSLDSSLRINESQVSLLSLIQTITEAAGADFFVELLRDPSPGEDTPFGGIAYENWEGKSKTATPSKQESTYAGIIKVWAIPRNNLDFVVPHIVGDSIDEALEKRTGWWTEEQFKYDGSSLNYREPLIRSANVGYEFNNIYTGTFMIGAPRTRVVGVTPQGKIKYRYDQGFDFNNDPDDGVNYWTEEYLPSTELDGANLGYVTGSWPKDSFDETGNAQDRTGFCANPRGGEALDGKGEDAEKFADEESCEAAGECSDSQYDNQQDCEDNSGSWSNFIWMIGYSNDDYRAWANDLHPFDEGVIKADMSRLNQASKGSCTASADDTESTSDNESEKFDAKSCENKGSCYQCTKPQAPPLAPLVKPVKDKAECDTHAGYSWGSIEEDTKDACGDADGVWVTGTFEAGDGYIDLYPMWGFKTQNESLLSTPSDGFIKNTIRGNPIKGFFNDDDPYRDFDVEDGIYSNKEYFDRHEGVCSDPGAVFTPDNPFQLVNSKKHMEACLFSKVTVTENGEQKSKKVATGNTYTLFCYDPYGRKEIDLTSQQAGKCTNYTCPEDECPAPTKEACCLALSGTWETTGDTFVTSEEIDITSSRCTFYKEPDPKNWIEGIRQAQVGGCMDETINDKKECDENAKCELPDGSFDPDVDNAKDCVSGGTCIKTTVDENGNDVEEEVDGNRQECTDWCCVEAPEDHDCETEFKSNEWTGWNAAHGDLMRPYTATIPVDLEIAGYDHGPSSKHHAVEGAAKSYYYATVTELRHAATNQDAWFKYMKNYDSWLPCKMEWKECIMNDSLKGGLKHAMEAFFGVGESSFPYKPPVMKPADSGDSSVDEHNDLIPYSCKGTRNDLTPEEEKKMQKNFSWRVVNEVATQYYGRTYLMSLPFAPPLEIGCSTDDVCQCCKDASGQIDTQNTNRYDCEINDNKWESPCEVGGKIIAKEQDCDDKDGTWRKYDNQTACEEDSHIWDTHGVQSEWTYASSKAGEEVLVSANKWDISSGGWPFVTAGFCHDEFRGDENDPAAERAEAKTQIDCYELAFKEYADGNPHALDEIKWIEDFPEFKSSKNLRYPGNQNFWDSDGNLTAFVAFPNTEIQRLSHLDHKLSFRGFNPESFYDQEHSSITSNASKDGTTFVKVSVDPKTYWLPEIPSWEEQHGESYEKFCHDESGNMMDQAGEKTPKTQIKCEKDETTGEPTGNIWKGKDIASSFIRPYALITLPSSARYDLPDTYADKRAQLKPNGEPFPNDCRQSPRLARCEIAGAVTEQGDGVLGTKQGCADGGGVWVEDDAMHNCAHHPGCHWNMSGRCQEGTNDVDLPEAECLAPVYTWTAGGACAPKAISTGGRCEDPTGAEVPGIDTEALCLSPNTWVSTAGNKLVKGVVVCIPLTKVGDSRTVDANLKAALNNMFHHPVHMRTGSDINKAPMVSAIFKPYYAGVPQQSNVYYWGAWSRGQGYGKVMYVNDSSYHPGVFGAESGMNFAANARCIADVSDFKVNQESERGSVTLDGPPFMGIGTHMTFATLPVPSVLPADFAGKFAVGPTATPYLGPVITDMSIDVGPDGISTTYNMQLNPKFGNMQKLQEQRIREQAKKIASLRQKQEEDLKRSRLPDPQTFRKNFKG